MGLELIREMSRVEGACFCRDFLSLVLKLAYQRSNGCDEREIFPHVVALSFNSRGTVVWVAIQSFFTPVKPDI